MAEVTRQFLLRMLEEGYRRKAWHGPTLKGALRGLTPAQAAWRPAAGRHNIWELIVHCAYWKYTVWRRLTGAKRGSFPEKGSNFFPRPEVNSPEALGGDLALLEEFHQKLVAEVSQAPSERLNQKISADQGTYARLVQGIAYHDVYHAGQIQLLKKLQQESRGS